MRLPSTSWWPPLLCKHSQVRDDLTVTIKILFSEGRKVQARSATPSHEKGPMSLLLGSIAAVSRGITFSVKQEAFDATYYLEESNDVESQRPHAVLPKSECHLRAFRGRPSRIGQGFDWPIKGKQFRPVQRSAVGARINCVKIPKMGTAKSKA